MDYLPSVMTADLECGWVEIIKHPTLGPQLALFQETVEKDCPVVSVMAVRKAVLSCHESLIICFVPSKHVVISGIIPRFSGIQNI